MFFWLLNQVIYFINSFYETRLLLQSKPMENRDVNAGDGENADFSKMCNIFTERLESRVIHSWIHSWCCFWARCALYGLAIFLCFSSVFLYNRRYISSTDFGYIMPLAALSSAALIFASALFKTEKKSDILMDVGVDMISEFLPSYKKSRLQRKEVKE